jgi:hypothetical protein
MLGAGIEPAWGFPQGILGSSSCIRDAPLYWEFERSLEDRTEKVRRNNARPYAEQVRRTRKLQRRGAQVRDGRATKPKPAAR